MFPYITLSSERAWQPGPYDGVELLVLHKNDTTGGVTVLRKFRAGVTVPAHRHPLANAARPAHRADRGGEPDHLRRPAHRGAGLNQVQDEDSDATGAFLDSPPLAPILRACSQLRLRNFTRLA
jgi:hypothetical protein